MMLHHLIAKAKVNVRRAPMKSSAEMCYQHAVMHYKISNDKVAEMWARKCLAYAGIRLK